VDKLSIYRLNTIVNIIASCHLIVTKPEQSVSKGLKLGGWKENFGSVGNI
jgi:hypothetical protein